MVTDIHLIWMLAWQEVTRHPIEATTAACVFGVTGITRLGFAALAALLAHVALTFMGYTV